MMRSVCVPFLSGPASTASSFVPLTCSYVLGSFFSTELCHDQFTARHMMAPSASEDLRDFVCNPSLPRFLSHIQNGHLYSYPALAAEWDCVPAFASPIPGYCLEEKSLSRHHLAVAISRRYLNSLLLTQLRLFACAHMRACVSVWAQKGEKQRSILKTSGSISAHFVQGPWETGLTAWVRRNHWQVLFDAATVCLCTCLFFNGPLTPHKANLAWDTWKHKGTIFLKLKTCLYFRRKTYPEQTQFPIFSKNLI